MRGVLLGYFTAFPDMRIEVTDAVEGDDTVAAETRFTGTHTGPMQTPAGEIPPTGRAVSFDSCDYIKLSGNRIQSWHVYLDMADFMAQLGVTPAPAEATDIG
jgi:predicted ester cyclase